jgi:hypothetical protein
MRKGTFYRALSVGVVTSIIIAVSVTSRPQNPASAFQPDSAALLCPGGSHIYMENTPLDAVRDPDGLPEVIGFYYQGRPSQQALRTAENWIPEMAAILICGLLGMVVGGSAQPACKTAAGRRVQ